MTAALEIAKVGHDGRVRMIDGERLLVSYGASNELVPCKEVVVLTAEGNATYIVAGNRTFKVRDPLGAVVARLADSIFLMQVRRNMAVNVMKVRRIVGGGRHRLSIVLDNGCVIDVGRTYQRAVRRRFRMRGCSRSETAQSSLAVSLTVQQ